MIVEDKIEAVVGKPIGKPKQKQMAAEEYCRANRIDAYKLLTKQTLEEMNIL
jgi:hypothetical protein